MSITLQHSQFMVKIPNFHYVLFNRKLIERRWCGQEPINMQRCALS